MSLEEKMTNHFILLFDGVCNLCEASIQFIIKRDLKGVFRFAPLQSKVGQALLKKFHLSQNDFNTMVLIKGERYYTKSSAALRITKHLNGAWPLLSILLILPPFFRDIIYDFIAKNRYRWFGKKETCMLPTPGLKERFFESMSR